MNFEGYIDHTLLKADATKKEIENFLIEAKNYSFASCCIAPSWVPLAKEILKSTHLAVCTTVGFPLGYTSTKAKCFEMKSVLEDGADEIDVVLQIGWLKSGREEDVLNELKKLRDVSRKHILKVILETCYLTDQEIKSACELCSDAKVDFVKTSTGFGPKGAEIATVKKMRVFSSKNMKLKAAGGIRDYQTALRMIEAGADRLGMSGGVKIIQERKDRE